MLTQFLAEFSVFNFITLHEKRFFQRNKLIGTLGLYLDFCDIYFRTFCTISNLLQPYLSPALLNQDSNCNFCKASNPPWQWRFFWSKTMNIQYLWCPYCLRSKHRLDKDFRNLCLLWYQMTQLEECPGIWSWPPAPHIIVVITLITLMTRSCGRLRGRRE